MKRSELLRACKMFADNGVWCITESALMAAAGFPDKAYFRVAMTRHVKAGVIEKIAKKLYENPFCTPPLYRAERVANALRTKDSFYLSLESALSEHGWISQMPSCLTFVTTGRSYVFDTKYLPIHFVHTEEDPESWGPHLSFDEDRGICIASPEKALEDLKRYGSNVDLVSVDDY